MRMFEKWGTAGGITLIATLLVTFGFGPIVLSPQSAEATTTPPAGQCVVDLQYKYSKEVPGNTETFHDEYRYSKFIKGTDEQKHQEWRFQTRTKTFGEVEHKFVPGHDFVDGGTTVVNGQTVSGHWIQATAGNWYAIPDSVINAVWGPGGIPDQYIGGSQQNPKHGLDLDTYGYPGNGPVVDWYATKEIESTGYTAYGPFSAWSTTNPGASTDTMNVETRWVIDVPGTSDKTVYYLPGGGQSDSLTAANWTTDALPAGYTQLPGADGYRSVSNNDGTPATVYYYLPGGGQSTTNTDANWTSSTETPDASWTRIANLENKVYGPCVPLACTSFDTQTVTPSNYAALGWETEDGMPTFTVDGLLFKTDTAGDRQNIFNGTFSTPVSGMTNSAYTLSSSPGTVAQASLKFEGLTQGTSGYATWSFEVYHNGPQAGDNTFHTYTITDTTLIWSSKIATGPGSQSDPQPVSWFKNTYSDMQFRPGLQLGSGNAGAESTVRSISWQKGDGTCMTATFTLDTVQKPGDPGVNPPTCTADGSLKDPGPNAVVTPTYNGAPGTYTVTYPAGAGNKYPDGTTSVSYTEVVEPKLPGGTVLCPTEVTPVNPTVKQQVCQNGQPTQAGYTIPVTTGVVYLVNGKPVSAGFHAVKANETVKVTAQAADNTYTLKDPNWSWTETFPAKICIAELPYTGSEISAFIWTVFALIAAGLMFILIKRYRRRYGFDAV